MCIRPPFSSSQTEREELEESLRRVDALKHPWCGDGVRVIAAARKYLDTLPMPPRKVRVTQSALIIHGKVVATSQKQEVIASWRRGLVGGDRVIELTGEYEQATDAESTRPAR